MTDEAHKAIRDAIKALPAAATAGDVRQAVLDVVAPMRHAYKVERDGDQIVVTFADPRDAAAMRGVLVGATVRPIGA